MKVVYQNTINTQRSLLKHYKHTLTVKEREMKKLDQAAAVAN